MAQPLKSRLTTKKNIYIRKEVINLRGDGDRGGTGTERGMMEIM